MAERDNCKGCSATVRVSQEKIDELLKIIIDGGESELAEETIYRYRLEQCRDCRYLDYETTCRQCGCIVHIRARLAGGTCPYPGGSKWCKACL